MPDNNDASPINDNHENASAIVLVIDRLSAGAMGPYGNTSVDTPELNRWAASGVLFDHIVADSIELTQAYESWWKNWQKSGLSYGSGTYLVTDDPEVASHAAADSFEQIQLIESSDSTAQTALAASAADTQLATFFAQATEALSQFQPGSLLWLHSKGMSERWDAPAEYRLDQCGPDDPVPPDFVITPSQWISPADADPDLLLGFEQAYAAQVILLDQLLSVFSETLRNDARFTDTWLVLASPRGYPLGQHGVIGDAVDPDFSGTILHQENLHVPLIVCPPAKLADRFATGRSGRLSANAVIATLLDTISSGEGDSYLMHCLAQMNDSTPDSQVLATYRSANTVVTKDWKLISDGKQHRLYSKPDDRWEVNNVADRCPVELQELQQLLSVESSTE